MNYEKAKQLKDAGFPQHIKQGDNFFSRKELLFWTEFENFEFHYPKAQQVIKVPTLNVSPNLSAPAPQSRRTINQIYERN